MQTAYPTHYNQAAPTGGFFDAIEGEAQEVVLAEYRQQLRPARPWIRQSGRMAGYELARNFAIASGAEPPPPPPETDAQPPREQWVQGFVNPVIEEFRAGVLETATPGINKAVGKLSVPVFLAGAASAWALMKWLGR